MSKLHAVRLDEVEVDPERLGWKAIYEGDLLIGLQNPNIGSTIMHAMVNEEGQFMYDLPVREDGPLNDDGVATPGSVVVPVRRNKNGTLMARSVVEWRPIIRDPETGNLGVQVNGLPGGFAKQMGTSGVETAFEEALSEAGITLLDLSLTGHATSDRATTSTCINYYVATYELADSANPEKLESIIGTTEFPLHEFPLGYDGIVNTAIAFAREHFGMVYAAS